VELWAEDEHRLGLKPVLRVLWAPRGQRPIVPVRPRYQWLWVVAFVCPESGATSFWLVPALTAAVFHLLLQAFAEEQSVSARKRILLVLDQAGWHISEQIQVPEGLNLISLPPYSPELQPAEHLWSLIDQAVANRVFRSLDELETALDARIQVLGDRSEQIRSTTLFHWWPRVHHK
jgi:transposase